MELLTAALALSLAAPAPAPEMLDGADLARRVDLLWPDTLVLTEPGGELERFEPLRLSRHGDSWRWTRYAFQGLALTDPARPGEPLVRPFGRGALRAGTVALGTNAEIVWDSPLAAIDDGEPRFGGALLLRGGAAVGGDTWVPQGWMDREPALRGPQAPLRRGAQHGAGTLGVQTPLAGGQLALEVEHLRQSRHFPTLVDAAGLPRRDDARRTSALAAWARRFGGLSLHSALLWQHETQTHAGAQHRFPAALTARTVGDVARAQTHLDAALSPHDRVRAGAAFSWRADHARPADRAPVLDLEESWSWLARWQPPESLERLRYDAFVELEHQGPTPWRLGGSAFAAAIDARIDAPLLVGLSHLRRAGPDRSVSAELVETARTASEWLGGGEGRVELRPRVGAGALRLWAALDAETAGVPEGARWADVAPCGGVSAEVHGAGRWSLDLFTRSTPAAFDLASFLDPRRARGAAHEWNDDGDLRPEPAELGARHTGGVDRALAPHLRRPRRSQLELGWTSPTFGPFALGFVAYGRLLSDRLRVRRVGPRYTPRQVEDPGDPAHPLTVFAHENPADRTRELVENRPEAELFGGVGLRLHTPRPTFWRLELAVDAFMSEGRGAFGMFPDRNDPGVLDPASADPNAALHARGRYDHDRAFRAHLRAEAWAPSGPLEGLRGGLLARYRDGQPTTRLLSVELPQGPVVVMTRPRGAPKPRHTFKLALDAQAAYRLALGGGALELVVEVQNVLGSGTELVEEPFTGPRHREPLEMITGRSVWVEVRASW